MASRRSRDCRCGWTRGCDVIDMLVESIMLAVQEEVFLQGESSFLRVCMRCAGGHVG